MQNPNYVLKWILYIFTYSDDISQINPRLYQECFLFRIYSSLIWNKACVLARVQSSSFQSFDSMLYVLLVLILFNFSHVTIFLFSHETCVLTACGNLDRIQSSASINGCIFSPVSGSPRASESSLQTALILSFLSLLPGSRLTLLSVVGMFSLHLN